MEKILEVKDGTIYRENGTGIDHMAIIYNKDGYVHKWGENSESFKSYYDEIVNKYRQLGLNDLANDYIYLEFDRYGGTLTIEEICTFANYMIMVSANSENIIKMLNMSPTELKEMLKEKKALGF